MEAHDVREALLLSALFAKRAVSLLREGKVADALEDAERVASITAELPSFVCSLEKVEISLSSTPSRNDFHSCSHQSFQVY